MKSLPRVANAGGGELIAVPSVHQSFPFAQLVNQLCADPATRPDAIAVELPAAVAKAAAEWLSELGVDHSVTLPCMLGLARKAHESDSVNLMYLTPTDSIVESIRCGLELGVPVFGIDLDRIDGRSGVATLFPDPVPSHLAPADYVHDNAVYATHCRDAETDGARERAMAKRLASLMRTYRRVLLVCGLAHWDTLRGLLDDETSTGESVEQPTGMGAPSSTDPPPSISRVIVHPLVALAHMDRFPAVVEAYERGRHAATVVSSTPDDGASTPDDGAIDVVGLYAQIIQQTDAAHFSSTEPRGRLADDWEARTKLEELLSRLCAVSQRLVPDAWTILSTAAGMISDAYRRQLATQLLKYPWAVPRDKRFCALPLLVLAGVGSSGEVTTVDARGRRGPAWQLVREPSGSRYTIEADLPGGWEWVDDRLEAEAHDMVLNWPPIDRMFTAMSLRAIERTRVMLNKPRIDRFTGSLRDGLAIKKTLRSHAVGRDDIFVRIRPRRRKEVKTEGDRRWDPVVWLFSLRADPRAHWRALAEPFDELIPHARDPQAMRDVAQEHGSVLVEQIGFGTQTWGRTTGVRGGHSKLQWLGMLAYIPTHFTLFPTSRFIEDQEFRSGPILDYPDPTSDFAQRLTPRHPLMAFFETTCGLRLDLEDWPTSLIRMAIPFARQAVTVVAPDFFSLPQVTVNEAAARAIGLTLLPHSLFSRENLNVMSTFYGACPVAGTAGTEFSPAVERRFGQSASANSHLLPRDWLSYGST